MTGAWPRTKWTEARQIGALLRWPAMPGDSAAPDQFFASLRRDGRDREAALFLGQALPRYEAVLWAAAIAQRSPDAADGAILAAVRAWLDDPSDANRRAAHRLVVGQRRPSAAQHCALAVFNSGGSLTPENQPPRPAPKDSAGRFAAVAVLLATAATPDRAGALGAALDYGVELARSRDETT